MNLARRLVAAIPWIPWIPVAVLVGLLAWATTDLQPNFASRQLYLRTGFLIAALGLSFAFDDQAAPTSDPTPSPLRLRRLVRLGWSLIPWSALLGALFWAGTREGVSAVWAVSIDPQSSELPIGRLVLEAATMAAWGLAIASVVAKRRDEEPGKIASAALLALYAGSWMVPERWKPWADPTDSRWQTALPWWWVALGLGVLLIISWSWDSRIGSSTFRWRRRRFGRKDRTIAEGNVIQRRAELGSRPYQG